MSYYSGPSNVRSNLIKLGIICFCSALVSFIMEENEVPANGFGKTKLPNCSMSNPSIRTYKKARGAWLKESTHPFVLLKNSSWFTAAT